MSLTGIETHPRPRGYPSGLHLALPYPSLADPENRPSLALLSDTYTLEVTYMTKYMAAWSWAAPLPQYTHWLSCWETLKENVGGSLGERENWVQQEGVQRRNFIFILYTLVLFKILQSENAYGHYWRDIFTSRSHWQPLLLCSKWRVCILCHWSLTPTPQIVETDPELLWSCGIHIHSTCHPPPSTGNLLC